MTRLDLPLSTSAQVVAVQREIQPRIAAVRNDRQLSPEVAATQLVALAQEATTKLTALIGVRGVEGYRQYGGGWLQQLQQPRPANAKAKGR